MSDSGTDLRWWVEQGDAVEALKMIPNVSVDALVTDPPAGISFMGREWDADKGGRDLPEGLGPWLAGFVDGEGNFDIHKQQRESGIYYYCRFEISLRADDGGLLQMLQRIFGGKVYYGSPGEGLNEKARWELVSRAECARIVDVFDRFPLQSKKARDFAIWREALAISMTHAGTSRPDLMEPFWQQLRSTRPFSGKVTAPSVWKTMQPSHRWIAWLTGILRECLRTMKPGAYGWVWALPRTSHWTATACEDAGFAVRDVLVHVFGTGFPKSRALLKPASEHWILIKAPGELRELRIEENRIGTGKRVLGSPPKAANQKYGARPASAADESTAGYDANVGRWPANFALSHSDECGEACADACPVKMLDEQSGLTKSGIERQPRGTGGMWTGVTNTPCGPQYGDSGGASRFFYQAKPSTRERSTGLPDGARNTHTTVKSIALMRHLISLVAAPSSLILDPFAGSGSTGVATLANGCRFVGIERETEYVEIARQRIHAAATSSQS